MRKGERTREMILEKSSVIFNKKGYSATSLAGTMLATGLEKGGIYNHFSNKDELSLAAFKHLVEKIRRTLTHAVRGNSNAVDRLYAVIEVFAQIPRGFPAPGGCPVMNAAIETDFTDSLLHAPARRVMTDWHRFIYTIVSRGVEKGELRTDTDVETLTSMLISSLEGAIMISALFKDPARMDHIVKQLKL